MGKKGKSASKKSKPSAAARASPAAATAPAVLAGLDRARVERGAAALLQLHRKSAAEQLFAESECIQLVLSLRAAPPIALAPQRVPLAHALYADADVCVVTRDPQREYRAQFEQRGVRGVSKIMSLKKLKANHRSFEERRKLCDSYDLFLADERLMHLLPSALGKKFFKSKKLPLGIALDDGDDWKANVREAIHSTAVVLSGGATINVRVARVTHDVAQVRENVERALPRIAEIVGGWRNVSQLFLKTPKSVAVPIYAADELPADVEAELREELFKAAPNVTSLRIKRDVRKRKREARAARTGSDSDDDGAAHGKRERKPYDFLKAYGIDFSDEYISEEYVDQPNGDVETSDDGIANPHAASIVVPDAPTGAGAGAERKKRKTAAAADDDDGAVDDVELADLLDDDDDDDEAGAEARFAAKKQGAKKAKSSTAAEKKRAQQTEAKQPQKAKKALAARKKGKLTSSQKKQLNKQASAAAAKKKKGGAKGPKARKVKSKH